MPKASSAEVIYIKLRSTTCVHALCIYHGRMPQTRGDHPPPSHSLHTQNAISLSSHQAHSRFCPILFLGPRPRIPRSDRTAEHLCQRHYEREGGLSHSALLSDSDSDVRSSPRSGTGNSCGRGRTERYPKLLNLGSLAI